MSYDSLLKDTEKAKILSRIIAHLMGDGCVTNRYFAYYNKNNILLEQFEEDMVNAFGEVHFTIGKVNSGTSFVMIYNREIRLFLFSLVKNFKSNYLKFPLFINTRDLQKEFLKSIYDDEGCVALRVFKKTNEIKRNLTLSSNSLIFLQEIKNILAEQFNIMSNKIINYIKKRDGKEFVNYVLSITGKKNFELFRNLIGFYHPDKIKRLDDMISSYIQK
ncbi:MAG TPA: LAGLIDADG family homing endonuclease [Candidatus Nanoarchaeia archaeon]|nr:LAGLIDADG family homing endonuclease [Candidatus Nanoarchaeia archaeon]